MNRCKLNELEWTDIKVKAKWRKVLMCSLVAGEGCRAGQYSLEVAVQLLLAAAGPVEAVEGSLHQGGHDAAQPDLVPAAVPLAVVLHS